MTTLELIGIWLILFSFLKNINNWQKNLFSTILISISAYQFLKKIDKYKDFNSFSAGSPLCSVSPNERSVCIYYDAVFVYIIGQFLWAYNALSKFSTIIPGIKDMVYYAIHTIPFIGIFTGQTYNWDLNIQLKTDIVLIIICVLNRDLELFTWLGFVDSSRFKQFDRSNFCCVCENIENQSNILSTDSDPDSDPDSDAASDADSDAASDADSDADSDANSDANSDADSKVFRKHYNTRSRKRHLNKISD